MVGFLLLDLGAASVADAQQPVALHPLHLQNKNPATNSLADAWRQAQGMKYNPAAWPGAALTKTSGPSPLVATLNTNNWEWLGPGNIGGRTRSIVIHPTQPGTMWVGGVGGGVWKTTNNAASFFPCNDWMGSLAVSCMALDPTNPAVLYAGTGEGFGNSDAIPGAGVFKSYDGGSNWVQLNNSSLNNYNINRLAISPTNSRVILAALSDGIARSTDAGTNWTTPDLPGAILDIAFHPTNGMQCIAAGMNFGSVAPLYSTNGGTTWYAATGVWTNGRIELAYAPSNPNIVYASQDTNSGTLWMSTNGGLSYTLRNTGSNYLGSQGWYANCIWVDPTSPSNLVVGGLDLWRSTDGGATLTKISDWQLNENNNATISVHADHHAIVSAPGFDGVNNTTVYFGNDGGLYCATNIYTVTTNSGWLNLDHNLGITQPYGIAANPTTFTTIIGSQDTGSTRWSPGQGTSWTYWGLGDGGFCAADPTDPNYFYGEYTYLQIYRSTNAAVSQNYIFGGIGEAGTPAGYDEDDPDAPHSANFIAPFVLDPNNPNTMLAGGSNLWRSVNVKAPTPTWTCITTNNANPRLDLTSISAIAVARGNSDIIWIGYNDGVVYQSTNGTAARPFWTRKSPGSFYTCTGLAIDPNNANTVYACFSGFGGGFYRTTDGGTTWTNLSAGLPVAPLHSVVVAPFNSSYVYVGSDLGVFGSADQGVTWSPANEGPANVQVLSLAFARNFLLAGTHGRGAYRIALGPPSVLITPASVTNYTGSSVTFSASVISQPTLGFQWTYDGKNLAGANSSTLTLTNLQTTNSGVYTLWATNSFGAGSGSVTLTVVDPLPYYAQALGAGPVAYWRLNETSGATAYDSVEGYNGNNNGSLVLGVSGPTPPAFPGFESSNTAYQFDGATTSIGLPALNLNTNTVTISAWVNLNGTQVPSPGIFFWQGAGNTGGQFLFGDTNNTLSTSWNGNLLTSTLVVPTNQWTFVALVVSPTNTVIYMATNSTLASWATSASNAASAFNGVSVIGAGSSGHFNGAIDEVTLYNQSLTPGQIASQLASAQVLLPTVTLTAPANGSSFVALSNILVTASVATNGHTIGDVRFFSGPSLLGESATPPYQATLSGATAGPVTLLAQAVYDGANVVSSLPVNITITNLPPTPANDVTNTTPSTPVTIPVLANDTDPYNLPLTLQSVTRPGRGTAVIAGTNVIYTPFDFWFGVDTFNYTVNDGFGATASASVTVTTPFPNFTSTYSNAVFNLGPVAYWRLNETSGATAFDSAAGHNGTNNGSLVLGTNGPSGPAFPGFEATNTAYQFDGADTSISFPALNLNSSNLTITAWLKSAGSQGTNTGIVSWGTNSFWFGFGSYSYNNNTLYYQRDGFSYGGSLLTVPSNQWTFVALVIGVPTNTGVIYMATNATLQSQPLGNLYYFFTPPKIFTNTAFLGNNTGHFFNGAMDEVAIFNKTLTAAQMGNLLAAALTGVPSVTLTAPTNGSSFNATSNILLSASVTTNGNHTIAKVQFFNTSVMLLGEAPIPPYRYSWSGMQAGSYSIFSRAIYDGSESVDSTAVSVTITNAGTVTGTVGGLTNPGGNPVTISFSGTPGHTFYVQRSTNLLSWTTLLTTNAPPGGLFVCADNFSDLGGPPPYAFYRLSWAP